MERGWDEAYGAGSEKVDRVSAVGIQTIETGNHMAHRLSETCASTPHMAFCFAYGLQFLWVFF